MPELDDDQSRALLDYLDAINPPHGHDCWRELINGRWVCFLSYGGQTYCLLPLHYSGYGGTPGAPPKDGQDGS